MDHDDVSVQVRRERGQPIHQFPRVDAHALSEATLAAPEQRHRYHGTIRAAGPLGRLGATVLEVAASELTAELHSALRSLQLSLLDLQQETDECTHDRSRLLMERDELQSAVDELLA